MTDRVITVFGATGTAGRAYAAALTAAGHTVRGAIRPGTDPGELRAAGIEPVEVDLHQADGATAALEGADAAVIALLGRGPDPATDEAAITRTVFQGAVRAGVGRIVYTSVHLADAGTGVAHFDIKGRLEEELMATGLPWTILRPTTFMDALDAPWLRDAALADGVLVSPIGLDAPISYVATADLAELVVRALEDGRLDRAIVPVGGPEAVTYRRLLPLLAEVSGRSLRYEQLDLANLATGQPHLADMVRLFNARGFVCPPDPLVEALGIALTDVESFLRRSAWAGPAREAS